MFSRALNRTARNTIINISRRSAASLNITIPPYLIPNDLKNVHVDEFYPLDENELKKNFDNLQEGLPLTPPVFYDTHRYRYDKHSVYPNNDLSLEHVDVYGFDYDYTLVQYNESLDSWVYDYILDRLVAIKGYPEELLQKKYNPFIVRGVVYDRKTGFFIKTDAFGKILSDCVYYGRQRKPLEHILQAYPNMLLPPVELSNSSRVHLFHDLFATSEGTAIADIIDVLREKNIDFCPENIDNDVSEVVGILHRSKTFHKHIMANPEKYITPSPKLGAFLKRLQDSGKKTFLLTNSPFDFVNVGMDFLLKDFCAENGLKNWRELFNNVVVDAAKPSFYTTKKHFREVNLETGAFSLSAPTVLKRDGVYTGGCLKDLNKLAGFEGKNVVYAGDHLFNDLLTPVMESGWRTCAVLKEIELEVENYNSWKYQAWLRQLARVDALIAAAHTVPASIENKQKILTLKKYRTQLRQLTRKSCNMNFGSVFRMNNNMSFFFHQLAKTADIYTGSITNLLNYPVDFTFYAKRQHFPHENPTNTTSSLFTTDREFKYPESLDRDLAEVKKQQMSM